MSKVAKKTSELECSSLVSLVLSLLPSPNKHLHPDCFVSIGPNSLMHTSSLCYLLAHIISDIAFIWGTLSFHLCWFVQRFPQALINLESLGGRMTASGIDMEWKTNIEDGRTRRTNWNCIQGMKESLYNFATRFNLLKFSNKSIYWKGRHDHVARQGLAKLKIQNRI